jgi:hypothetical protein
MSRSLSKTQIEILKVVKDLPDKTYFCSNAMDKIKTTLYPNLYNSYGNCLNYGEQPKEKNRARVIISRSIRRLEARGLIIFTPICNNFYVSITPLGILTVNELAQGKDINQKEF